MKTFKTARDVTDDNLGTTVFIEDENRKMYISAEFSLGRMLSGHSTKEEYLETIKTLVLATIITFGIIALLVVNIGNA